MWTPIDKRADDVRAQPVPDLSEPTRAAIRELAGRYPSRRAALLPAMHLAQQQIGWLAEKTMLQVAELLDLPAAEVLDAASFYEMFWRTPKGRRLIQVCDGFACELCGQADLLGALEKQLGIKAGETTPDGKFTLVTVPCLAACDRAPAMMIEDELLGPVTAEMLKEILREED